MEVSLVNQEKTSLNLKAKLISSYVPKKNDGLMKDEENIRRIIHEAFQVWEEDTVMRFKEERDAKDPDILITFEKPKHSDVDPYAFGPTTLGHAFQPGKGLGGDAHFNNEILWDFDVSFDSKPKEGKISFFAVALHELGHSLGKNFVLKLLVECMRAFNFHNLLIYI